MTKSEIRDKQICLLSIITGLPLSGLPNYKFGFRSSAQKNGPPGEGRHEGLVPRNDVLTNGFIGFSLARTLARILFVPRLRPPQKPGRRCGPEEGYLRCSITFSLFEFKSVDDVGAGKLREMLMLPAYKPTRRSR